MIYETRQLAAVVELGSKEQDPVTFPMAKSHMRKALKKSPVKSRRLFCCRKYLRTFTLRKDDFLHTTLGQGRAGVNF